LLVHISNLDERISNPTRESFDGLFLGLQNIRKERKEKSKRKVDFIIFYYIIAPSIVIYSSPSSPQYIVIHSPGSEA